MVRTMMVTAKTAQKKNIVKVVIVKAIMIAFLAGETRYYLMAAANANQAFTSFLVLTACGVEFHIVIHVPLI